MPVRPSVRKVPSVASAVVIALLATLPNPARSAGHPAWAADGPYNGAWITGVDGSYPNRDPGQLGNTDDLLPAWITHAMRSAGLRMESNESLLAPTTYQVFAPNASTRVIAFVSYGTTGCPMEMGDPNNPEPTPCPLHVLAVHADGNRSAMRSAPGCSWWQGPPTQADHVEFRRIPTTGRIEMRVIVRGHIDRACSTAITP